MASCGSAATGDSHRIPLGDGVRVEVLAGDVEARPGIAAQVLRLGPVVGDRDANDTVRELIGDVGELRPPVSLEGDEDSSLVRGQQVEQGFPGCHPRSVPRMTVTTDWPLRFGVFLAPFHNPNKTRPSPCTATSSSSSASTTSATRRPGSASTTAAAGRSSPTRPCSSPPPPQRTKHLRLGTGRRLAPLPPPAAARRSHGAARPPHPGPDHIGVGPGQLTSDAKMLGIDPNEQRPDDGGEPRGDHRPAPGRDGHQKHRLVRRRRRRAPAAPLLAPMLEICVAATFSPAGPKTAARFGANLLSVAATAGRRLRRPRHPLGRHRGGVEGVRHHARPAGLAAHGA